MKKKLFYNISDRIHSNNISEILILFGYFRNMYPCHRRLSLIFSQQYSQVLLNEGENLKCLKSKTIEKMKNNYLYRCYYIHFKDSFIFIVCSIQ